MQKFSYPLFCLLVILLPQHTLAAAAQSPINELDSLVSARLYQEAFDLGLENRELWEGDSEFDFLFGIAALESGNANEAVFALERAVAASDDRMLRQRARLELARAYLTTNNLIASENLFNQVLATNPPENVRQNIESFLQLIQTRRDQQTPKFNVTLSTAIGADDNINSATSNAFIDTPLIGQIELSEDGQQLDDNFSNTRVTANYNYPFDRNRSLDATLDLTHLDNFDTDQFDIDSLRGEIAYNWGNATNRITHGLAATGVNLDQNGFQKIVSLNTSWQHSGANGWFQSLGASYSRVRYETGSGAELNNLRDINQTLIMAGLTKVSGLYTHSVNLYTADEDPEYRAGTHNGRAFTGLAYSLLRRLNAQHTAYLRASLQNVEHDSEHPVFFDTVREDDTDSIALGWLWQVRGKLMINAEASYTDNGSNIELFDYSRFRYQAGLRYRF